MQVNEWFPCTSTLEETMGNIKEMKDTDPDSKLL